MILYHGSYTAIEKPDLSFSRDTLDFGRGFYATPIKEQAIARLRFNKPNIQYCFKKQAVMDTHIRFVSGEEVR
jgi:hypothetical protein